MAAVDCTGHGVPGAFMSLIANSKLNKVINEMKLREPSEILRAIHMEIMEALHQENMSDNAQDGMDLSLCVIDFATKSIKFSGANNSICLVSGENVEEYKSKPVSIGGNLYAHQSRNMENPFETIEISYHEGDMLYMFTDGFPDQLGGEDNKKFNKARFRQMLRKIATDQVELAGDNCQAFLDNWRKAMPQTDDILLIGARLP
jgi:serine phosphatase RsbU (regulator of sigma subunit)